MQIDEFVDLVFSLIIIGSLSGLVVCARLMFITGDSLWRLRVVCKTCHHIEDLHALSGQAICPKCGNYYRPDLETRGEANYARAVCKKGFWGWRIRSHDS